MRLLLWRGIMEGYSTRRRAWVCLLPMVLSVSFIFTQCGYAELESFGLPGVYALQLLLPVSLAALMLGTIVGLAHGAFTGVVLYLHSIFMPLDYHELTSVTPEMSIGAYAVCGLVLGLLFALLLPRCKTLGRKFVAVAFACVLVALFSNVPTATAVVSDTAYDLFVIAVQTIVDALIMIVPSYIVLIIEYELHKHGDDISLRQAFRISIIFVVAVVYIVSATISYVTVTIDELDHAEAAIRSEVNYICIQLDDSTKQAAALDSIITSDGDVPKQVEEEHPEEYSSISNGFDNVLSGYTMEQTGTVALIVDGRLLMTDDGRLSVGEDVYELFGEEVCEAIRESVDTGGLQRIIYDGVLTSPGDTGGYDHGKQIGFLLAQQQGRYTVLIIEPSSMVYRDRDDVLIRQGTEILFLLAVLFVLVSHLLDNMVAKRIDTTNEALGRITDGDLDVRVDNVGTREFKSLSVGINLTVDALQGLIAEAENRMKKDLETARAIQEGALPRQFPAFPSIDVIDLYASMDAAKQVGGDFYDFFEVDERTVAFIIADVSGKGIPASLFMMAAKAEIQNYVSTGMELEKAIEAANDYLCAHNEAQMFVTVWAATLDWQTGVLTYVNAGHNPPLLRRGVDGPWEWMTEQSGMFLGFFENVTYKQHQTTLLPDDEIVLYTDGVNEAFNPGLEEYGNDRLEAFLAAHPDERPESLARALRADVSAWANGAEQSDDVTILALEYAHRAVEE